MHKIMTIGTLGKDPEKKSTKNGMDFIQFSLAVNPKKDDTIWYEVNVWEDRIKSLQKALDLMKKGSRIMLIGDLNSPYLYQDKEGNPKAKLSINAVSINFIGSTNKDHSNESKDPVSFYSKNDSLDEEIPF